MLSKELLRKEMKERFRQIPAGEFCSQGERAVGLLSSFDVWPDYSSVYIFLSMDTEIDTRPLIEAAFAEGKKVFVPRVDGDRLLFYRLNSSEEPFHIGAFGIREPASSERKYEDIGSDECGAFPALVVCPGLAFDREGNRLGRGRGYYDRFFMELDDAGKQYFALGFCMDFQLVERVPADDNDKGMNGILTGDELLLLK